jgi:hypothetical protein
MFGHRVLRLANARVVNELILRNEKGFWPDFENLRSTLKRKGNVYRRLQREQKKQAEELYTQDRKQEILDRYYDTAVAEKMRRQPGYLPLTP